jgi:hypothetical protein
MSDWHELMNVIDSCSSLFLRDIGEPEDNVLRLVLHEGKVSPQSESLEIGGTRIDGLHRVYTGADSRLIELVWRKYVAYGVTNESFACRTEPHHRSLADCCDVTQSRLSLIMSPTQPSQQTNIRGRTCTSRLWRRITSSTWFQPNCRACIYFGQRDWRTIAITLKMIPPLSSGEPANLLESANGEIGKHCSATATRTRSH